MEILTRVDSYHPAFCHSMSSHFAFRRRVSYHFVLSFCILLFCVLFYSLLIYLYLQILLTYYYMASYKVMSSGFEFWLTGPTLTLFYSSYLKVFQKQPPLSTKVALETFLFTTYLWLIYDVMRVVLLTNCIIWVKKIGSHAPKFQILKSNKVKGIDLVNYKTTSKNSPTHLK